MMQLLTLSCLNIHRQVLVEVRYLFLKMVHFEKRDVEVVVRDRGFKSAISSLRLVLRLFASSWLGCVGL